MQFRNPTDVFSEHGGIVKAPIGTVSRYPPCVPQGPFKVRTVQSNVEASQ
ncbi:MAG: hypothetical protein ACLRWP_14340 [Bilophila wadsworthia]